MVEIKKDEAKKDLQNLVNKSKADIEKEKESLMSAEEKKRTDEAKAEAEKKRKDAEAQATKDADILKKKDEELSDEDKKRKTELLDKQKKAEDAKLSPAVRKIKEETQKRIDEIKNELLQVKDKTSKEADELHKNLKIEQDKNKALEEKLTKPPKPEDDINSVIKKEEEARVTKYLEEDKNKPREQRREMSEEEWDAWFLEEPRKATAWESRQENRRTQEHQQIHLGLTVNSIKAKQGESVGRVWTKHPELNTLKREAELKAEGKSAEEIYNILCKENEKYRVFHENLAKLQERNAYVENLPELVMAEMEKQLGAAPVVDEKQTQIDDLTKKVEDLTATIQQFQTSDEGINSTITGKPPEGELTPAMKQYVQTAKEMKLPQAAIDKHLKKMRESGK